MRRNNGYERSRPNCIVGPAMMLIAGSMTCSTLSPTRVADPGFLLVA